MWLQFLLPLEANKANFLFRKLNFGFVFLWNPYKEKYIYCALSELASFYPDAMFPDGLGS